MTTLDTLCVRLEAEAGSLFQDLDTLEHRLTALRGQSGQRVSLPAELEMRLSGTAPIARPLPRPRRCLLIRRGS